MEGARGALRQRREKKCPPVILVVEDEVLVRMAIADQLRVAGYVVLEAAHAHEAIEVLRVRGDVGLVISDIRMPGPMDGVGLARLLRSQFPAAKIILTSSYLSSVDWADHDGFFRKPYDVAQIVRHMKSLIA
jgi:two-component system, response regulator PdtaR